VRFVFRFQHSLFFFWHLSSTMSPLFPPAESLQHSCHWSVINRTERRLNSSPSPLKELYTNLSRSGRSFFVI
jgi:hypothetical protein